MALATKPDTTDFHPKRRKLLMSLAALSATGCATDARVAADPAAPSIQYRVIGHGPEGVLVMHEWLGDHNNWEPVWPYLNTEKYSFVFVDLRGYGWSKAVQGAYSANEAAQDAAQVMRHLGFQRYHVVGHSMSGMVAQRLALNAPQQVKSMVAISPVPASGFKVDDKGLQSLRAIIDDDEALKRAIAARGGSRYGDTWINFKLKLARNAMSKEAMAGYLNMFTQTDFSQEARGLSTPILAITGKYDLPFYQEESVRKNFSPLYPNFQIKVCQESGHYSMLEAPVFLASSIEAFIRQSVG